ncbi:MAG TPA: hypothetical protein VGF69_03605 [Thermoanaerobaculia bacterium]|jgi:lauroyl/myristoyl acyltransferase
MIFRLALALVPLLARTIGPLLMRRPGLYACTHVFDESLRTMLAALNYAHISFTPKLVYDGPADLQETIAQRGGLFVSAHYPLNVLTTRWLHDRGIPVSTVRGYVEPRPLIWGTRIPPRVLLRSPNLFVQIRSRLAEKEVVLMLVDNVDEELNPVKVETVFGTFRISPATFHFARRIGAPLFFTCVRIDETGRPRQIVRALEPAVEDYARVLQEETAAVRR